ncbi:MULTISPECIES: oligoendopeptidase F [unclassified Fusibacter]|uniref:oligoendopeptidase F n=1 Tax=unclassified Fusibacter TaxID=2624464 RepID=UPI0019D6EDDE|nr:oligoendopeptidase F [Fusibacter sp. A1]MCK8059107.1 oligoendopeptidase F [Fusibacter sp. A2]
MKNRYLRTEVPEEMTWDLTALFSSSEEWHQALHELDVTTSELVALKGKLAGDSSLFFEVIKKYEQLIVDLFKLGAYASLNQSVDGKNVNNQELAMLYSQANTKTQSQLTFIRSEIMELSEESYRKAFVDEPRLLMYHSYLEDIYNEKPYKLSAETEKVLSSIGELTSSPYKTYSVSKAADMVFDDFLDSSGNVLQNSFALFEGKYEYDEDAAIRTNAYASFTKTLERYQNTYASLYSAEVKKQVALSRLRGYDSVTEMLLKPQNVTVAMYERQIEVIYNQLAPHMRKYARLLKEELKLDTLHFYDLKAPIDTSYNPPATFEQAKRTVIDSLEVMGKDYVDVIEKAFDERWIDYADNVGKATGAFCSSPYAAHPYILMTFQDNMRDAFTLTHELGHAGHFYLANKHQSFFNTRPSTFTVEAPSTMNEMLLGRFMMNQTDDPKLKKWVILQFLGTYYHNFVTHLLEAAFQQKVYALAEAGKPLTAKLLCNTKLDVLKTFWGETVTIDEAAGLTWMRQAHYYMGLYPYTYSAGLTASTAACEAIFIEGQAAVDRWLNMLKAGGTLKPLDLLAVAGLDMKTSEPIEKAVAYVGSLIDSLIELCR